MADFCKRGHDITEEANKHWHKRKNGQLYFSCKKCHARLQKLKYRNDDAYREAEKARARTRYYARKEKLECFITPPSPSPSS